MQGTITVRRTLVPILAAGLLLGVTACGSSSTTSTPTTAPAAASPTTTPSASPTTAGSTSPPATTPAPAKEPSITIGSANFPENVILADIYADALEKAGIKVTSKLNIGAREVYFKALENGQLNLFPEYNGALLDYLSSSATASSTAGVNEALAKVLPASLEALPSASAQDKDSITVTEKFAAAHHLKSIGDLKAIQSSVTVGGPPEFATREEGLLGLKKLYGLSGVKFKPLDESGPLTIAALNDGTIQAGDVFTTDPSVAKYHFVALADPLHLFAAQNVTPIIAKSVATPLITKTIDAVSASLTTADLVTLVGGVVNDHDDPGTVAAQFVSEEKLG
jgi:osmoprotectant transport system substrate-binding protein